VAEHPGAERPRAEGSRAGGPGAGGPGAGEASGRLVIGLGNPDRGDDAAGRVAVRALAGRLPLGVALREAGGMAAELVGLLATCREVWIVDATSCGAAPGTLCRFDAGAGPLPASLVGVSSHGLGLGTAVELARALGCLPARCIVWGIEGARFDHGAALSPEVAGAVGTLAARIRQEVEGASPPPMACPSP